MSAVLEAQGVEVRPATGDGVAWNRFVAAAERGSLAHRWEWSRLLAELFGHEPIYLSALAGTGELAGVLPLVRIRSRVTGHHLVSVPFLNEGGPVGSIPACAALVEAALNEARRSRADSLELRCRKAISPALAAGRPKLTVLLDLPDTAAGLWSAFPSKLRSQIRRPMKAGMEMRFGPEQLNAFYQVYARNMRDLGTPVHPRRFFSELGRVFADRVLFAAVYRGSVPVAGGCGFLWRNGFELNWASALREHNRDSPNMLLYWSLMQAAIERGARVFDFGRCTPGEGSHRFKLQWGGVERRLEWTAWSRKPQSGGTTRGHILRHGQSVWRRLPLWAANRLGPRVAPMLPWF